MQGDDTDSSQSLHLEEVLIKGNFKASFKERFGNGYCHEPVAQFSQDELYSAMKIFADKYLK